MTVTTTKGDMDEALLQRMDGDIDNDVERTNWVEYWLGGDPACQHKTSGEGSLDCIAGCGAEQVHRSAGVILKKAAVFADGTAGIFPT